MELVRPEVVPAVLVLPAAARVVPVELAALVLPVAELVVVPVRPVAARVVLVLPAAVRVVPAAQVPEPVEPVERAPVLPSRQGLRWSMPREQVLRWQAVFRGPAVRRA